jgi:hypothetical protein
VVFGSLVERWNAFIPVMRSLARRGFSAERVAPSRYRLKSHVVEQKNSVWQIDGSQATAGTIGVRCRGWRASGRRGAGVSAAKA